MIRHGRSTRLSHAPQQRWTMSSKDLKTDVLSRARFERGDFLKIHGAQFPAQSLPGDGDAEFLEDPLAAIDHTPPHDPMSSRNWAALYEIAARAPWLHVVETGRLFRSLPVD